MLTDEDIATLENHQEGVEIIGMCIQQELQEDSAVGGTRRTWEDFQVGLSVSAVGVLSTHDEDSTVGHKHCRRVPTGPLSDERHQRRLSKARWAHTWS